MGLLCYRVLGPAFSHLQARLLPPWSRGYDWGEEAGLASGTMTPHAAPDLPSHVSVLLTAPHSQNVLSEEFKASEIEVGVVRADGDRAFRVLNNEEVEHFLVAISERD